MYTQIQDKKEISKNYFYKNASELFDNMEIKQEIKDYLKKSIENILKQDREAQDLFWELMNLVHFIKDKKNRHDFIEITQHIINHDNILRITDSLFCPTTNFPQCDDDDIEKICAVIRHTIKNYSFFDSEIFNRQLLNAEEKQNKIYLYKTITSEENADKDLFFKLSSTAKEMWFIDYFAEHSLKMLSSEENTIKYNNSTKIIKFPLYFFNTPYLKEMLFKNLATEKIGNDTRWSTIQYAIAKEGIEILNNFEDVKILLDFFKKHGFASAPYWLLQRFNLEIKNPRTMDIFHMTPIKNFIDELKPTEINYNLLEFLLDNPSMPQPNKQVIQNLNTPQIMKILKIADEHKQSLLNAINENEKLWLTNAINNDQNYINQLTYQQKEKLFKSQYYNNTMHPIHQDINELTQKNPDESKQLLKMLKYNYKLDISKISQTANEELMKKIFTTFMKEDKGSKLRIEKNWDKTYQPYQEPSSMPKNNARTVLEQNHLNKKIIDFLF